jgi:hypothetical protein
MEIAMKTGIVRTMLGVTWVLVSAMTRGAEGEKQAEVHAVLELSDGSRLSGTPVEPSLKMNLKFSKIAIPLDMIRQCEVRHKEENATLSLRNGDTLTGIPDMDVFPVKTLIGTLTLPLAQIDRMTFSLRQGDALPAGEGTLAFGGVNWLPWRTLFDVQGDKLVSLPKARPGFSYGHGGNGRGPMLMSNIGSGEWKDYSLEVEFCMRGVAPAFNPHGLPLDYRGGSILFHVADAKESWNERGSSCFAFSLGADGAWSLGCAYNFQCRVPSGWGSPFSEGNRSLAEGRGLKINPTDGNKFRIDVCGTRIQVWMDDAQIADVRDEKMSEVIGDTTLDHGGVGFQWGYDSMGWIRNFSARRL